MIVEYIRYETADAEAFVRGYEEASRSLDASTNCLAYELTRCVDEPKTFVLRIEWDSAEGHMNGFRKSAEFGAFFAAIKPFLGEIKEMRHYELTKLVKRK